MNCGVIDTHTNTFTECDMRLLGTTVCYGFFVSKPAVPSAESIGTGATGNGRGGNCRDNVFLRVLTRRAPIYAASVPCGNPPIWAGREQGPCQAAPNANGFVYIFIAIQFRGGEDGGAEKPEPPSPSA